MSLTSLQHRPVTTDGQLAKHTWRLWPLSAGVAFGRRYLALSRAGLWPSCPPVGRSSRQRAELSNERSDLSIKDLRSFKP